MVPKFMTANGKYKSHPLKKGALSKIQSTGDANDKQTETKAIAVVEICAMNANIEANRKPIHAFLILMTR